MLPLLSRKGTLIFLSVVIALFSVGARAQTRTTLEGVLHTVWGDPHRELGTGGKMISNLALADGTVVPLDVRGQESVAVFNFGKRVIVSGQLVPNPLPPTGNQSPVVMAVDTISPVPNPQSALSSSSVSGTKKVIYLLLKFSDDAAVPHPPAFYTNLNNPDTPPVGELFPATINGFFKSASEGTFSWVGDVGGVGGVGASGGWLTLPQPKSYYANCGWSSSCANLDQLSIDGTALGRAQGIDFKLYDNINFVLSNDLDCCAWGGGWYSSVDAKSYGATWEPPWGQETGTYAHEMGHSLGLPHSGWVYHAYDSPWDNMSARSSAQNPACGSYTSRNSLAVQTLYCSEPGNEYIAPYKDYLGWIPSANVVQSSNIGSVGLTLESSSRPSGALAKMLKICISGLPCTGSTARYFTVEARTGGAGTLSQFDNGLPGEGVIIHEFRGDRPAISGPCFFNSQSGWALPIDSTPNDYDTAACNAGGRTYPNYALNNAQWGPGQTYVNSTYGFSVAVLSRSGSTFVVSLNNGVPSGTKTDDFNGDGKSDIVWQQNSNGYAYLGLMNGTTATSTTWIGGGTDWTPVGNADYSGDGKSDLLWQQNSTGFVYMWLMNGATMTSSAYVGGGAGWTVPRTGDFNGDGKRDILWRQSGTGYVYMALMNGTTTTSLTFIGGGTDWSVVGTGDYNGDGKTDILWQQNSTGYVFMWLMNGTATLSTAYVGGGAGWHVAGNADFNGDGKSDILWKQPGTGYVYMALMNGTTTTSLTFIGGGTDWVVAATGDYNGDGKSDILWQQSSTGFVYMWLMNGVTMTSSTYAGGGAGWFVRSHP